MAYCMHDIAEAVESLMGNWLEQASQWHETYCHDLEVMSSNLGLVELGLSSTSVPSRTSTKNIFIAVQIGYVTQGMLFNWTTQFGQYG